MASIRDRLDRRDSLLAECSVFELLRRNPQVQFDPHIAHAGLIYDPAARALLAEVHRTYLGIAAEVHLPVIVFADTWRASGERIAASRFAGRNVNGDNVEFLRHVAASTEAESIIGAYTGPRGDAYRPREAPSRDDAKRYHARQIEQLAAAGAELIVAATLPALEEARGIAELLEESGAEWMLSFVVRASGHLLDGTPLAEAIELIDAAAATPPVGYSLNCVHPEIARQALASTKESARRRVRLFQGNASMLSPEELDGLAEISTTDAGTFAASIEALVRDSSISVAGGCCGTDESHMRSVARRLKSLSDA